MRQIIINYSIDNLILPMEAANAEEQDKQGYIKKKSIPENILNNTSLETIKVLKILSEEASLKPKFQNGIPINFKVIIIVYLFISKLRVKVICVK